MLFKLASSFLPFIEISQIIAQIGFYSSSLICTLFISLTLLTMKKRLGAYSYLVVTFATVGIIFAAFEFVLYPNVHTYNASYLVFLMNRSFLSNRYIMSLLLTMYTGVYASTISMLSVLFIYRYWAVFDQCKLRLFRGCWLLVWMLYCSFFGIQWAIGVHIFYRIDDFALEYLRSVMEECYNLNIDDVTGLAVVAYNADGSLRYWNLMGLINMSSIMALQYAIIIYCAVMMYRNMEEKLKLCSSKSTNLHRQLFKTLVLQITAPSVTLFFPIATIILLPLFNLNVNLPTGVIMCMVTVYPAMDAIIIMCIVTDYRRAVRSSTFKDEHDWRLSVLQKLSKK